MHDTKKLTRVATERAAPGRLESLSGQSRIALVLGAAVGYGALFVSLHGALGTSIIVLAVLPIVLAGWLLGWKVGLVAGLVALPLNVFLFNLAGAPAGDLLLQTAVGSVLVLIGVVVGRQREVSRQLQVELGRRVELDALLQKAENKLAQLDEGRAALLKAARANEQFQKENEQLQVDIKQAREDLSRHRQAAETRAADLAVEQKRRRQADTLHRLALAFHVMLDLRDLYDLICREATALFEVSAAYLLLVEGDELVGTASHGVAWSKLMGMRIPAADSNTLGPRVVREMRPLYINNAAGLKSLNREFVRLLRIKSILGVPLVSGTRVLGAVMVVDTHQAQHFSADDLELAAGLGSLAGIAVDNVRQFSELRRRVRRLDALHKVDLTGRLDMQTILESLLDQVLSEPENHAVDVLLVNPHAQTLHYAAGQGFLDNALEKTHLVLGEGHAGRAALERSVVSIANLTTAADSPERAAMLAAEGFRAYHAVPLIANGQLKGVMEVFHRNPLFPDPNKLDFLKTLASRAALSIGNAELFDRLQRANIELAVSYDSILEGWTRALDLREREAEGHTRRVTELTVRLARELGMSDEELVNVRRGALLHDIGKLGVPDTILLKAGPLTNEEWAIMRKHPQIAFELLSPIASLRPALDIPYCHHENWDGTGYPRGLQGEQIPFAARIFAVVDLWDSVRIDRPYRAAWDEEKARSYISDQAGRRFDAQVVKHFLRDWVRV